MFCKTSAWMPGILLLSATLVASAADPFPLIRKAQPDEFFTGVGKGYFAIGTQPPGTPGQPKVNSDYVWGMNTDGRQVWFGTGNNVGAYSTGGALGTGLPLEFKSPGGKTWRVWEFSKSQYPGVSAPIRTYLGDWRPPKVYQYDSQTGDFTDRTPNDPLINSTLGLRACGIHNGVVIIGGPSLYQIGICLFAFDAVTGEYLGSQYLPRYSGIRRWQVVDGVLYCSVKNTLQVSNLNGSVLRWRGTRSSPFQFEIVGLLDNEGAYMTAHEGRLFVGTWPSRSIFSLSLQSEPPMASLWMSPVIPSGGLTQFHAVGWKQVWLPSSYDPDPAIAKAYAMGACNSFDGWLYWGTMHFPGLALQKILSQYGQLPPLAQLGMTDRTSIVLRGRNWGQPNGPEIQLLYGDAQVPVFKKGLFVGSFQNQPNKLGGVAGIYGNSGFGDKRCLYIWSSTIHNGQLILGTFDYNVDRYSQFVDGQSVPGLGADLWRFPSSSQPADALSQDGLGNPLNHGIRNMVSTQNGLFLGTANGMNMLTDPTDNLPEGGWELRKWVP